MQDVQQWSVTGQCLGDRKVDSLLGVTTTLAAQAQLYSGTYQSSSLWRIFSHFRHYIINLGYHIFVFIEISENTIQP